MLPLVHPQTGPGSSGRRKGKCVNSCRGVGGGGEFLASVWAPGSIWGQVVSVGCPEDEQCRLENQIRHFLLGAKTQGSGFGAPGDSPCGLCVGSDVIVPLKEAALCNLHIKRLPLWDVLTSRLWETGWLDWRAHTKRKKASLAFRITLGSIALVQSWGPPSFPLLDCSTWYPLVNILELVSS